MKADIMIEDVKPVHCRTGRMRNEIERDSFAQQRAAWECLEFFEQTPPTEVDFNRRFAEMAADDITLLKAFYRLKTGTELLAIVCRFWDVSFDSLTQLKNKC
jgi:hypothetical protein